MADFENKDRDDINRNEEDSHFDTEKQPEGSPTNEQPEEHPTDEQSENNRTDEQREGEGGKEEPRHSIDNDDEKHSGYAEFREIRSEYLFLFSIAAVPQELRYGFTNSGLILSFSKNSVSLETESYFRIVKS